MKNYKLFSIIFMAISLAVNIFIFVFRLSVVGYTTWIMPVIGAIIFIFVLLSFRKNKKNIPLGILAIIFTSIIGGIFYLMWKVDDATDVSINKTRKK